MDSHSTPQISDSDWSITISQYYTITKGIVQWPPFNITADLKFWVWLLCIQNIKCHSVTVQYVGVKKMCPCSRKILCTCVVFFLFFKSFNFFLKYVCNWYWFMYLFLDYVIFALIVKESKPNMLWPVNIKFSIVQGGVFWGWQYFQAIKTILNI